jgi:membrane-associated protease RseP (regulator of RpoE activity)
VNNLIIIPLFINGSDTLHFVLDTGVQTALLTNIDNGKILNINGVRTVQIRGLGDGEPIEAYQSHGNQFQMSDILGVNIDMLVLKEDIFLLSQKLGLPVHGLIGYDIFKSFVVEVDYDKNLLILHNPQKFKRKKKKGKIVPISIENTKPYIKAKITQEDSSKIEVKLIIDTGASHSISLDKNDTSHIILPTKTMDAFLGKGLNGDIKGKIGRLISLQVLDYQLFDLVSSYPDEIYTKNVQGVAKRHGNLGGDVLKRFRVIFDYQNAQILLKPSRKFKDPFNYDMSGIDLNTPLPGFPLYIISNITQSSPAQLAGLQKDDQIVNIDGKNAADYSLNDLITIFQSKHGKKIKITVKRNEQTLKTTLVLKKVI